MKKLKKNIKSIIKTVIIVFFITCFAIILIQRVRGKVPTLFNLSIFVVVTDSMTPKYEPGDVILINHKDASKIKKGDDITYNGMEGDFAGKIITHRVVDDPYEKDGVIHFQTQGIKQFAALDPEITENEYIGKVVTKLSILTICYKVVTSTLGFIFVIAIPMIVLLVLQILTMKAKAEEENKKKIQKQREEEIKKQYIEQLIKEGKLPEVNKSQDNKENN